MKISKQVSVPFHCRQYDNDYKLQTYLKIARLYLEDEDPVQAEAYINRASMLQADSKNAELQIYYKVRVRNLKFATYLKFATCENTNKINELW